MKKLLAAATIIAALAGLSGSAAAGPYLWSTSAPAYAIHWSSNYTTHSAAYKNGTTWSEVGSAYGTWDSLVSHLTIGSTTFGSCPNNPASNIATWCFADLGGYVNGSITCAQTYVAGYYTIANSQAHWNFTVVDVNSNVNAGDCRSTSARRLAVACHEAGHTLGLDHYATTTSCLQSPFTTWPTAPNSSDASALESLYNHADIAKSGSGTLRDVEVGPLNRSPVNAIVNAPVPAYKPSGSFGYTLKLTYNPLTSSFSEQKIGSRPRNSVTGIHDGDL